MCIRDRRDTVQSDDRQSTLYLVQMGPTEADLRQIAGGLGSTRRELLQCLVATLQRKVDLALDPGQRADIEARRGIHGGQVLHFSLLASKLRTP